ncbi:MAG: threonylcarbamoyl-AMP synthase [Phycisphaerae bacterium]|nr:threonylcarbamoyl-AMP synthase [Phycisphaerae bacterium]
MSTEILTTSTRRQAAKAVRRGAGALSAGQLVGFPTETVYGVGALATEGDAVARLRDVKGRPERPFSVHLGGPGEAERYVHPDIWARRLMRRAWPGALTLVLPATGPLADAALDDAVRDRLVADDWIGLRCPDEPIAAALLAAVDGPVVASSANPPGAASPRDAVEVLRGLPDALDVLIDAGRARGGTESTIVRLADGELTMLREGAYTERQVRRLLRWRLLFVCTGNTCRSPMAAALAKAQVAQRLGVSVGALRQWGVEIRSAGLVAADGLSATAEAVDAAKRLGADVSQHRSGTINRDLIAWADVVFCMTDVHVGEVLRLDEAAADRVRRLDADGDIPDPVGRGEAAYHRTAERIRRALEQELADIV